MASHTGMNRTLSRRTIVTMGPVLGSNTRAGNDGRLRDARQVRFRIYPSGLVAVSLLEGIQSAPDREDDWRWVEAPTVRNLVDLNGEDWLPVLRRLLESLSPSESA